MDNADRETASASELKEGTYEFKLTVTDSEGLTGSDAVVVTVKQSKCYVNFSSKEFHQEDRVDIMSYKKQC